MPNNPTKIHVRQIKQLISSSEVDLLFSEEIINPSHIVGGTSVSPINFSSLDTTSSIQSQLNSKLESSAISNSKKIILSKLFKKDGGAKDFDSEMEMLE